ncbi:MAG: hypothetical protein K8R76_00350 [Candidatus Aegiribacteria sp.]|nr:hypothetical protein [Candidatus Aegiribacteria sp.]
MKPITALDVKKIVNTFDINPSLHSEDLLKNIISSERRHFGNHLFFEYVFYKDPYIENKANTLIREIVQNNKLIYVVHGYSKNGKSTFINYVCNKSGKPGSQKTLIPLIIDFEKYSEDTYSQRVKYLLLSEFPCTNKESIKNTNRILTDFLDRYDSFLTSLSKISSDINPRMYYFQDFCKEIRSMLRNFIATSGKFMGSYDEYYAELKERINAIDAIESAHTFGFYVFYLFYKNRVYLQDYNNTILLVLDNIDDCMHKDDMNFLDKPQFAITRFIKELLNHSEISRLLLKSFLPSSLDQKYYSLQNRIKIVYVLRTANMFVYAWYIDHKKASDSTSSNIYNAMGERLLRYTVMDQTRGILESKLEFYNALLGHRDIKFIKVERPAGFRMIKYLALELKYSDDLTPVHEIFRLWNGSKRQITKAIGDNWTGIKDKYMSGEDQLEGLVESDFNRRFILIRGYYLHLFMTLIDISDKEHSKLKVIIALYSNHNKRGHKNMTRYIINYIVNESYKEKKYLDRIGNIKSHGTTLDTLLDELNDLMNKVNKGNELPYERSEVKEIFRVISELNIDNPGQIVTMYQNVYDRGTKEYSHRYDISKILNQYETSGLCIPNEVRIYANDNAYYLADSLLTHYEVNAVMCNVQKPMICYAMRTSELGDSYEHFGFYKHMRNIYSKTETRLKQTLEYYIRNMIEGFPPHLFVQSPLFSILEDVESDDKVPLRIGDFYFRKLIHSHINYLDVYRRALLNGVLGNFIEGTKLQAIKAVESVILDYAKLYVKLYDSIDKKLTEYSDKIKGHKENKRLKDTYKGVKRIIREINSDLPPGEKNLRITKPGVVE